jgi:hypothetical protein
MSSMTILYDHTSKFFLPKFTSVTMNFYFWNLLVWSCFRSMTMIHGHTSELLCLYFLRLCMCVFVGYTPLSPPPPGKGNLLLLLTVVFPKIRLTSLFWQSSSESTTTDTFSLLLLLEKGNKKVLVVVKTRTGNQHDSFQNNSLNTSLSSPVSRPPRMVGEPTELHHRSKISKRTGPTREPILFQGPDSRHPVH